jgi:NADH-quinone oxidoreductase subunit F
VQVLQRMVAGQGTQEDIETLLDTCDNIFGRSFCALGDGATSPIVSSIKHFRADYERVIAANVDRLRSDGTRELVGAAR